MLNTAELLPNICDNHHYGGSLNHLANFYSDLGRFDQAEPLLQRALTIYEESLGPEHPKTSGFLSSLAKLYTAQDTYEQAEKLFKRALIIYKQVLGLEHPDTIAMLTNYISLLRNTDRENEAERLQKSIIMNQEASTSVEK